MDIIKKIYIKWSDFSLSLLHILAMLIPFGRIKRSLYRSRGTTIGRNVDISQFVFMEDSYPSLITIEEYVDIGPKVIIVTHDSSLHCIDSKFPIQCDKVLIKKNAYIGAGALLLPGVVIGEYSIVAAGSVVTKDVPPYTIVAGVPARKIGTLHDKMSKYNTD
jgi:acetyltransferase-like isoleucine patch superfamily enzyme